MYDGDGDPHTRKDYPYKRDSYSLNGPRTKREDLQLKLFLYFSGKLNRGSFEFLYTFPE